MPKSLCHSHAKQVISRSIQQKEGRSVPRNVGDGIRSLVACNAIPYALKCTSSGFGMYLFCPSKPVGSALLQSHPLIRKARI